MGTCQKMRISTILSKVDHTLLSQTATWDNIKELCDDALKYHTASVCIPPCYVKQAHDYLAGEIPVCTVIGFPNGYSSDKVKAFEARDSILNGADEIDMVINIGLLKAKEYDKVLNEIKLVKSVCGKKLLKVIIEACLLTEEEKIKMCELVSESGADFIKTSTGFSSGGATFDDVRLMKLHIKPNVKLKAAGGISSLSDAEEFIRLGADRLGTSRIVKILKNEEAKGY